MNSLNFAADSAPEVGNMDLVRCLREGDRPRFLCCLFAPEEHRDALLALYNFNLEIARVRLTVSDPVVGQLRLKWWYDAAERLGSGTAPNHPVVQAMDRVARDRGIDTIDLLSFVQAHADDLAPVPPAHMEDLYRYVDRTAGIIQNLAVWIVDPEAADDTKAAAAGVARAWGLSRLLWAAPSHAARGWLYLPPGPNGVAGRVTVADLNALRADVAPPDHVVGSLRLVAEAAEEALRGARCRRDALPVPMRAALLPGALAGMALDRLRRVDFNPTKRPPRPDEPGPLDMIRLWLRARAGRY
jgi:phytoene/squalene synthetase